MAQDSRHYVSARFTPLSAADGFSERLLTLLPPLRRRRH